MTNTHLNNNEMNPLMSGYSPKRFKEENNLEIEEKEKINLNESNELKNDDKHETDKDECLKDDQQKAEGLKVDKVDKQQTEDDKDDCEDDKNNVDDIQSASPEILNQQSHKENVNQTKHNSNKTINNTKQTFNIFQFDKPKTDQAKPSPFLFEKNEVKEEEKKVPFVVSEGEKEIDHIFKEKCCFYKFFKKWEKIGYGTVYVTREKENNRLIFFREGTMSKLIDLLLNFDCKPYKKEKGVGFINFKEVDGKIIRENVLLSFDSQLLIDDFYEMIRK
ncbi:hypothetical protein NBO_1056g0001 [Nosema bombycis CQ1]|uniref:PH domain-containing protein n=1 Tax=Nosema bombycis (strain CQ1 / CVCC 102059) TaxID=578461 RepID=R0KLQ6_NOSB1|nr:hypothetical protein NBO_1056g0001 [Nosema bombycis CQ1]|eukprot:EOB11566.1 hypothetical protein NBO_1056g0001 [Nosema bombycis CQ1]